MHLFNIINKYTPNQKKIISNIFWASFGKLFRVLTVFVVGIFIARHLGPDQYGLMNYVISIVSLFTILANFGLDNIEVRELSKTSTNKAELLGSSLYLRLILSVITIILIIVSLILTKTDKSTSVLILIYSLSIIFTSFNIIRNYFTSIVENKYIVISETIRNSIGALIKVVLLLMNSPLTYFICALTFDFLLIAVGYVTAYQNKGVIPIKSWRFNIRIVKKYLKESFPLLLSGAAVIIYQRIDQIMIKNMIDNTSLGYFSIACNFTENILFIPLVMAQTMAPILVKKRELNIDLYNEWRERFVSIIVCVAIGLASIISLSSHFLIRYTFGIQYIAAVPVLQIMAFKAVGMALSNSSGQLIIIEGIQKWAVIRNLVGCAICILGNLIMIPRFGIIGSAWVTLFTVFSSGFFSNYIIRPYRQIFMIQVHSWKYVYYKIINVINHV